MKKENASKKGESRTKPPINVVEPTEEFDVDEWVRDHVALVIQNERRSLEGEKSDQVK